MRRVVENQAAEWIGGCGLDVCRGVRDPVVYEARCRYRCGARNQSVGIWMLQVAWESVVFVFSSELSVTTNAVVFVSPVSGAGSTMKELCHWYLV